MVITIRNLPPTRPSTSPSFNPLLLVTRSHPRLSEVTNTLRSAPTRSLPPSTRSWRTILLAHCSRTQVCAWTREGLLINALDPSFFTWLQVWTLLDVGAISRTLRLPVRELYSVYTQQNDFETTMVIRISNKTNNNCFVFRFLSRSWHRGFICWCRPKFKHFVRNVHKVSKNLVQIKNSRNKCFR